jgi:ATP-dependent helicase HrpA
VRIDKLRNNPARDAQLMADWKRSPSPWEREWLAKAKAGVDRPAAGGVPLAAGGAARRLYAQELKTPMPVSVKRLQKIWDSRPR